MSEYKGIRGFKVQTLSTDPAASIEATGSWSSGGNLNSARAYSWGAGTLTAGIVHGGYLGAPGSTGATELYDGSSWTEVNDLNTARHQGAGAGSGTQTAALQIVGYSSSLANDTTLVEEFDGSTWTAGGTYPGSPAHANSGSGTQTAALSFGSNAFTPATNEYNGSTWTSGGTMSIGRSGGSGLGLQTATLSVGGLISGPSQTAATEEYNGTAWTTVGSLNTAKAYLFSTGTTTAGLAYGGTPDGGPVVVGQTEYYDGTSWTELNDLATSRRAMLGGGTASAAFSAGGNTGSIVAVTEEWTITATPTTFSKENLGQVYYNSTSNAFKVTKTVYGTGTWASGGNLNSGKAFSSTGGATQSAALNTGGYDNTPTGYDVDTELYNGTSWTEVNNLNTARRNIALCGTQTSSIAATGYAPAGSSNAVELWDGTNWTTSTNYPISVPAASSSTQGSSTSSIVFGGLVGTALTTTNTWNGSSWTSVSGMNTGRYYHGGIGTETSALSISGNTPPETVNVESWNGTSWTEVANVNTHKHEFGSAGASNLYGIAFGGENAGAGGNLALTESWNGSAWTEVNDLAIARRDMIQGSGTGGSATTAGGNGPPGLMANTEEWTVPSSVQNQTITVS
jgi:hypothetical protein